MAPFELGSNALVSVLLGIAFGFTLERAGFGNANKLVAQFYLYEMRVLKVMFTAIVTAMVLLFWSSALGLIEFSRVGVNLTHLWPGIIGGIVLGMGFILGGYCPGTALVSAATLKLDGLFFVLGVAFGAFVFVEALPSFWWWFQEAGYFGRLTLFDWLGVDAGIVVLGVVFMALGMFYGAEWIERIFTRDRIREASK
jgi:hypothetical protein